MGPDKFFISDEFFFVENEERFAMILEDKLGWEAAQYYRSVIAKMPTVDDPFSYCGGECTKTYEVEEEYENILRDIQDDLKEIDVDGLTKSRIQNKLNGLIDKIDRRL